MALARLPESEQDVIRRIAAEIGVQPQFLAAIRVAEGGGPGREFGVLSQEAPTYEEQCRVCARSIRNNLFRYVTRHDGAFPVNRDDRYSPGFIAFMAARWAPVGVANDPSNLNAHWVANVTAAYEAP